MKKLFAICMSFTLGLVLIACGVTTAPTTAAPTTATPTTEEITTTTEADAVVLGNYVGTHTVSAMGSDVVYNYLMVFDESGTYTFHSIFTMSDIDYSFDESGTYSVDGSVLTITPTDGDPVAGTVNTNGTIEVGVKASEMGSRASRSLTPTKLQYNTNYVGTHTVSAMGSDVIYHYTITLGLDGTYSVFSTFIMSEETYTFTEIGTFTQAGSIITITPDAGTAVEGTINNDGTINVSIKASSMGTRALRLLTPTALTYNVAYAGTHTVSAMGSDVVYTYTITFDLFGNYAFHSDFTMSDVPYTFDETGSFTLVGTVLSTTPLEGVAVEGTLNADGSITVSVKASSMGARALRTLVIAE
jgi:hypothetical protein